MHTSQYRLCNEQLQPCIFVGGWTAPALAANRLSYCSAHRANAQQQICVASGVPVPASALLMLEREQCSTERMPAFLAIASAGVEAYVLDICITYPNVAKTSSLAWIVTMSSVSDCLKWTGSLNVSPGSRPSVSRAAGKPTARDGCGPRALCSA